MHKPSPGSIPSTDARPSQGPAEPPRYPAGWHPASEADFTLDDLLLSSEGGPSVTEARGPAPSSGGKGESSIFADDLPAAEEGSDFLRDYEASPVHGSNIFADAAGGADLDTSFVDFNASPGKPFRDESSQSGDDLEQSSHASNELLEELDRPFPEALERAAGYEGDGFAVGDDGYAKVDLPEVGDEPGPGSTLFRAGEPAEGETAGDLAFDLAGRATRPDDSGLLGWSPSGSATPRPVAGDWSEPPVPRTVLSAPELDLSPPAARRRGLTAWLGPVAGAALGAGVTAAALNLAAPAPPPPAPPVVLAPPAPAPAGVDLAELARAREDAARQLESERARGRAAVEAARRDAVAQAKAHSDRARAEAEARLRVERDRARRAGDAAQLAEATRARLEAALALVNDELKGLKARPAEAESLISKTKAELAASRVAAEAARAEANRAKTALAKAEAAALTEAQRRGELEGQLAREESARRALEAELAKAAKPSAPDADPAPTPGPEGASAGELLAAGLDAYEAGRFADAERRLAAAGERGADARAWYFLGFAQYRQGRDPQAAFRRGAELERQGRPNRREVHQLLEGVGRDLRAALAAAR